MARTGSTASQSTTTRRSRAKKADPAVEATVETTEAPAVEIADEPNVETTTEATPAEANTEVEETNEMTDTVETVADEATDSDTTEATEATVEATPAAPEFDLTAFEAAVQTALAEKDSATGDVPTVNVEAVKAAYRDLTGAKAKGAAKKYINEQLRERISNLDIQGGQAVMTLNDAIQNAGSTPKATAERKPVDPSAAYVDSLAVLHLAYSLRRGDVPEGVETEGENGAFAKVDAKVDELSEQADRYYAWTNSKADDKGDEPEVDPIVKRAVKAAMGRAASARTASTTPRATSDGVRRNVRTHIGQVFADKEPGTFMKISEIANTNTEEYPEGVPCSPGAVSAALKSEKGVEGFEFVEAGDGHPAGARNLA